MIVVGFAFLTDRRPVLCSQTTTKTTDIGCTISWRRWSIAKSYPSKREFARPNSNGGYSPSYWWTDWRKKTPRTNENSGTLSCLTFIQIAPWGRVGGCCVDLVKKFTSRLCLKSVVKANTVVTVLVVLSRYFKIFQTASVSVYTLYLK